MCTHFFYNHKVYKNHKAQIVQNLRNIKNHAQARPSNMFFFLHIPTLDQGDVYNTSLFRRYKLTFVDMKLTFLLQNVSNSPSLHRRCFNNFSFFEIPPGGTSLKRCYHVRTHLYRSDPKRGNTEIVKCDPFPSDFRVFSEIWPLSRMFLFAHGNIGVIVSTPPGEIPYLFANLRICNLTNTILT